MLQLQLHALPWQVVRSSSPPWVTSLDPGSGWQKWFFAGVALGQGYICSNAADDKACEHQDWMISSLLQQAKTSSCFANQTNENTQHRQPTIDGLWCWSVKGLHYVHICSCIAHVSTDLSGAG
eukprot:GHUV01055892.1.p1 GENE.GHUV01055892.1~~GHUV01055892.1.p1  ORF type:complete len:123 (-),score=7.93 GHUV01055892.1:194-562(-)